MDCDNIIKKSLELSKPYWDLYEQLIGKEFLRLNACLDRSYNLTEQIDESSDLADEDLNPEYLELMRITKEHQAKREKEKRLRQKKGLALETYYKDISQVDTLVEDNLVDTPDRNADYPISRHKDQALSELYGGPMALESVRSMEMAIDDFFHRKYQELKPGYWPVIPINYRRYLNKVER